MKKLNTHPALAGRETGLKPRKIKYLVIHTTASHQHLMATDIQHYFLTKQGNKPAWTRGGYHVIIEASGKVVRLYDNNDWTNGVKPYENEDIAINNLNAVHVSWIGGIDPKNPRIGVDNRTFSQREALKAVVGWYLENYPTIQILGHNQISPKDCPCFNVPLWLKESFPNISDTNIYKGDNFGFLKVWNKA